MYKIIMTLLVFSFTTLWGSDIKLPVSFSGGFEQTVTSEKKKKITYSGSIKYSSPKSFKWVYTHPTKKEVCTNGEEILVVDHELEQISAFVIDEGLDLAAILKNAKLHKQGVYVAKFQDKSYTIQINAKGELARVVYKDDLDNIVLIIFKNLLYSDKPISSSKLQCNYPANYDEIRE